MTLLLIVGVILVLVLFAVNPAAGLLALVMLLLLSLLLTIRSRSGTRPCPRCGQRVKVGELDCPHCDFDFRTI